MKRALYPGSFDPITLGHLDVIERAARLFDELVVAVAVNNQKEPLFSVEERVTMIREALGERPGITVVRMEGLLVDFAVREKIAAVVRGLRAVSDFEFEFQMALMNRRLHPALETVFLMPKEDCSFLSSRLVKEVARLGGDVAQFVPEVVIKAMHRKFGC